MQLRGVPGAERPLVQWLIILFAVAIVALAVFVLQRERLERETIQALREDLKAAAEREERLERQLARERSAREAFEIGLGRERAINTPQGVPLEGGLDPSGHPKQRVRLPQDVARVQFVLPLKGARLPRYRAALRSFSGSDDLWVHAMLRADVDPKRLYVAVPVDLLVRGSYELALTGFTEQGQQKDVEAFTFEIVK
jgi:hypothetical protein